MENRIFFVGSIVFCGLILLGSLLWNIYSLKNSAFLLVNSVGQTFFEEIKITRLWNARHGGVYVPITEKTPPNPYLEVPNRDIISKQNQKFTLINPAYMTRQIAEIARNESNIQYHITSLKPIRPENRADEWEKTALTSFEKGNPELMEYVEDKLVFRYMAPLFVRQACLKCHAKQEYKIGDIRGGISVTFPAKAYIDAYNRSKNKLVIIHSIFFLIGVTALYLFGRFRDRQLAILNKNHTELENEVVNRVRIEKALAEKSMYLDSILSSASEYAIVTTDLDLRISYYNPLAEEFFGYPADKVIGKTVHEMHMMESVSTERLEKAIEQVRIHGEYNYEVVQERDIGTRYLKSRVAGITNPAAELIGFALFSHDITERRQAEEALRDSEEKYRNVVRNAIEAICVIQDGMFKYFNPEAVRLFGYTEEELAQLPSEETIYPEDKDQVTSFRLQRLKGEHVLGIYSHRIITKDDRILWVEIKAVTITWNNQPAVLVFLTDITDRKQAEEQIRASLKEKETLLQEIHHRVKNNLDVVSSLLFIQAETMKDERVKEALMDSQNRVQAMSMIHETLYQSEDLSAIDLNTYLSKLAGTVSINYAVSNKIKLKIEAENIMIEVKQASPLGLIVNELITNSLKYAFPANQDGEIKVNLHKTEQEQIEFVFMDNGVGIPNDFDWYNTNSMGLNLVKMLAEGQLGGTIELKRDQGTCFIIKFNLADNLSRTSL